MKAEVREARYVKYREYKAQGHTMKEVAEKFGISEATANRVCKGIAKQIARPEVYKNQYTGGDFDREANAIQHIKDRTPWFEYAGNFTGTDGYVDLKCKTCGSIIRKSFQTVRAGSARCEECKKIESERARRQREAEAKAREEERKEAKYFRLSQLKAEQLSMQICEGCGSLFVPMRRGLKYCSNECMKKTMNAIGKDKRLRRINGALVDKDIDLQRLYMKYNGKCAICGDNCNWNDSYVDDNGTFIAGNNYPSIDHIVPLSEGGLHAWDNVQLAHRFCNSKKGKRVSPPGRT